MNLKFAKKPKDSEAVKKGNEEYRGQDSISMAEVEPYWKSMWGEAELNERTKRITRD